MTKHSNYAPSASSRWLRCTGSVALINEQPEPLDLFNEAALFGSRCHAVSEEILAKGKYTKCEWVTDEMVALAKQYVDYVNNIPATVTHVEEKLRIYKDAYGTPDCIKVDLSTKTLHIIDAKFGRIQVDAKNNTQLLMYALGAVDKYLSHNNLNEWTINLHVVQPTVHHYDEHSLSYNNLMAFKLLVTDTIDSIDAGDTNLVVGPKQCLYCPVKMKCSAFTKQIDEDFEPIPDNKDIDVSHYLSMQPVITRFYQELTAYAVNTLSSGGYIKGFKLVAGRGRRVFTEDGKDELKELLGKKAWTRKLIGITAADKLLTYKTVSNLCVVNQGQPVLVTTSDKRESLSVEYLKDFETIDTITPMDYTS